MRGGRLPNGMSEPDVEYTADRDPNCPGGRAAAGEHLSERASSAVASYPVTVFIFGKGDADRRRERMELHVYEDKKAMGQAAAAYAAEHINAAIELVGGAGLVLATGASQFEMLDALVDQPIEWNKVTAFHLDEYLGLADTHPASFRRYLRERFVDRVGELKAFHWVDGDANDPAAECARLNELIRRTPIDVACVGIGENGHLAFNDPPADIDTTASYIVVDLDEQCRRQQLGEGWFATLDDVPTRAVTMTIHRILSSRHIVCTVPDRRKAEAVKNTVEHEVSETIPASLLQTHIDCHLFLDEPAASRIERKA